MTALKKAFFPILIVLFLGYLGFSLVLPLFPPLFLEPDRMFLPNTTSQPARRILLGLLFAMYPIGQFIGAPILGKLSDKYGRKPLLLLSFSAIIPTYVGCALAITYTWPLLLFLSRLLCGLLEGNVVIAQAAIADISENQAAKTKNFGWLVSFSSLAFFFGPLIGSTLSSSHLVSWFHYDTPFWAAAFLVCCGLLAVYYLFKETTSPKPDMELSIKKTFSSFIEGVRLPRLTPLFAAHFLIFLAMFFFFNFFSAFLISRFHFTILQLGQANAYLSLFLIISPVIFKQFARYFPPHQTLIIGSIFLGISLVFFSQAATHWSLLLILIPTGMSLAIGFAFPAILISEQVDKSTQGQALGTNLSIQVLAEALTALIGGFLLASWSGLPLIIGALCSWLGGALLFFLFYTKRLWK